MRNIYTVNAKQVVISQDHPEGLISNVSGYPVPFDSRQYKATEANPNGDESIAMLAAQANYSTEIVTLITANNANRVGWYVNIVRESDGREIQRYAFGGFPDMTPAPEPEPEE